MPPRGRNGQHRTINDGLNYFLTHRTRLTKQVLLIVLVHAILESSQFIIGPRIKFYLQEKTRLSSPINYSRMWKYFGISLFVFNYPCPLKVCPAKLQFLLLHVQSYDYCLFLLKY